MKPRFAFLVTGLLASVAGVGSAYAVEPLPESGGYRPPLVTSRPQITQGGGSRDITQDTALAVHCPYQAECARQAATPPTGPVTEPVMKPAMEPEPAFIGPPTEEPFRQR